MDRKIYEIFVDISLFLGLPIFPHCIREIQQSSGKALQSSGNKTLLNKTSRKNKNTLKQKQILSSLKSFGTDLANCGKFEKSKLYCYEITIFVEQPFLRVFLEIKAYFILHQE